MAPRPGSDARPAESPTAEARRLALAGDAAAAGAVVRSLIEESLDLPIASVTINRDGYSLNSLNGVATTTAGDAYFFKFHQEEDEAEALGEYYRADLLSEAGYPVDLPAYASTAVGRQILLYPLRQTPRLADLCLAEEQGAPIAPAPDLIEAQEALDRLIADRMLATLHEAPPGSARAEPIHQLFHHRLADRPFGAAPGGRLSRFYENRPMELPDGSRLDWETFSSARWVVNGVDRRDAVADVFRRALQRLHPDRFDRGAAVTAHGDAHNANVWFDHGRLTYFDPAFAGRHVPALLAEVKATFHNIFAHPFWLYHPDQAMEERAAGPGLRLTAHYVDGVLTVEHDWRLTPLRAAFLDSKARHVWAPLIQAMNARGMLPPDWLDQIGLALFCCPTLVLPMTTTPPSGFPRRHSAETALLGWCIALACASPGSESESRRKTGGSDPIDNFRRTLADAATPAP